MDTLCHIQVREDLKAAKLQGFVIMCLASFDEMWDKEHIIEGYELVVEFQVWESVYTISLKESVTSVQCD